MKYPKKLEAGGTVGLICPSSSISQKRIQQCVQTLQNLGYRIKIADNLDADVNGYIAGSGQIRADWINRMFADPEVDAVFCARGGDGSSRVMEFLDYELIRANPKILLGYSDVTNLILGITQNCRMVVFHGPMVSSNMVDDFDEETAKSFFEAVQAEGSYSYSEPKDMPLEVLRTGEATGVLTGGNLSLLSASIGTPYELDTKGKILFIEEVGEPMSKIEKWMMHLRNAGKLQACAGVLFGQFTEITNKECPQYDAVRYIMETGILDGLDIPIVSNVQSGHGAPMITLPMGAVCTINTKKPLIFFKVER